MMLKIPNFTLKETLHQDNRVGVFRAIRENDRQTVLIKVIQNPLPLEVARLHHEFDVIQVLRGRERMIEPYAFVSENHHVALVMENVDGIPLDQLIKSQKIDIKQALMIAIETTKALQEIHRGSVIHKDLQPKHIIVDPTTNYVKVIDFGFSTRLEREMIPAKAPEAIEGALLYISPEQTGRIHREITYRTDFYALGVIFYEAFTGHLPFVSSIPMELVYHHIATPPMPPHKIDADVPPIVSNIILKLLEKNAEDRYKSASGIIFDLERCLQRYEETHAIHPFPLCQKDVPEHFFIPEKLYGRENHIEALFKHFEKTVSGACQLVLVKGESGIGKSVLIHEIQRPLSKIGGFFITGKCDQFKQNIFYNAIIEALQQLIEQILSEPLESIERWRQKILNVVGPNGQIIIDVVPTVEKIIGKQQSLPDLSPKETRDRFLYYFQAFIQVFIAKEHPLILFLDDLQWIDLASLEILKRLLTDPTVGYLLVFGAYDMLRILPNHPLMPTIEVIGQLTQNVFERELTPLRQHHIAQLLSETFNRSMENTNELAAVIKEKTEGNPFFIKELLKNLTDSGMIFFSSQSQQWEWHLNQIRLPKALINVPNLLEQQISTTSEEVQKLLKFAAILGNVFSARALSKVTEKSRPEIVKILREPIQKGIILPIGDLYEFFPDYDENIPSVYDDESITLYFKFAHDRVQLAVYLLMSAEESKIIHYQIGKRLLATTSGDFIEEMLFDIIYHLNDAADLVENDKEKLNYARLNLLASKKAKNASSYQSATEFAKQGLKFLTPEKKVSEYALWKNLSAELAECYYHIGDLLQARQQFENTLEHAKTKEEKIKIFILWNRLYMMKQEYHQAIEMGFQALALLDYPFPKKIGPFVLWKELMRVKWFLFRHSPAVIRTLPQMTNKKKLLIAETLFAILPPSFVANQDVFFFAGLRMVLMATHGVSPFSLLGFSTASMCLPWLTSSYKPSRNLGELSLELSRKYDYKTTEHFALFVFAAFLADRHYPLQTCIDMLKEAYEKAIVFGDLMWAGYAIFQMCFLNVYVHKSLNAVLKDIEKSYVFNEKSCNDLTTATSKVLQLYVFALQGKSKAPNTISNEEFDTASKWELFQEKGDIFTALLISLCEANLCFLHGDYKQAKKWIDKGKEQLIFRVNFQTWVHTHYLECLVLASLYPSLDDNEKRGVFKTFQKNLKILKKWASDPTKNKCHFYPLAKAESLRLFHPDQDAIDFYLQAIEMAKENHFFQEEAIANEITAKYQIEKGREKIADAFLKRALIIYQDWGAQGKVKQLESRYPHLFPSIERKIISSTQVKGVEIDLMSVIDASRVMAGELVVDKLLTRLMEIVVTTAGATKAFLLLADTKGKLAVMTEWDAIHQKAVLLDALPVEEKNNALCQKIISYVEKVKEPVVLRSAFEEGMYVQDPYIANHRIQSVLCIPLIHKDILFGILYLENKLAAGSFTEERVEILRLLSSEIAIAIDNATLYTNLKMTMQEREDYKNTLERKVDERTIELRKKKEELEQTLQKLHITQKRVVQQEKLAALGFFTQGVAHEIQNPLNFVNNFSELMVEQFSAIARELTEGEDDVNVQKIKSELENVHNLSKRVNENGIRIKKIVDVMLEHGKVTRGEISRVNVNELLHQSSEIAYQDYLSKDSTFDVTVEEYFDDTLTEIEGFPQDLSRVFFNIIHNAFYAAFEKKTTTNEGDHPTVLIKTKENDGFVDIIIRDNGKGIPENIKDDVLTQFFTTKPPGAGAGLGLSLSYDIVVHEHKGELIIHSSTEKEKSFTEVSIKLFHRLPIEEYQHG